MTNKITKLMLNGEEYEIREYQAGWQPGENTIAYYPLDSINTVNDLSGNGYNLTNSGNVTFGTYNGVDCADFGTSTPRGLRLSSGNIITGVYTYLAWINVDINNSGSSNPRIFGGTNSFFILWDRSHSDTIRPEFSNNTSGGVPVTSGWHLVCFTGDVSNGTYTSYKDGVYLIDSTGGQSGSYTGLVIGAHESDTNNTIDSFVGQMSQIIWENRQRTAQEISDYYDLTKSLYGIS